MLFLQYKSNIPKSEWKTLKECESKEQAVIVLRLTKLHMKRTLGEVTGKFRIKGFKV
jgi:hypothetical protein